ncbi:MAG: lipase family protein [Pseudonocardia sp.]|nr:lipase family protein [Pseudonocardia sp.]
MPNMPMDRATAVSLGPFNQAAHDQFLRSPKLVNPPTIANLPAGFTLERTIQMSDFIFEPSELPKFYGYLVRGGEPIRQIIAIRGTAAAAEWWDNLHFLLMPFDSTVKGGGKVVQGFYDIYRTLTTMNPAKPGEAPSGLFDKIDPNIPIIVTGHSLGAALATLLVADMSANTPLKPQAWTFASPKVGDANFAATYGYHSTVSWRIYNIPDIIPRVPIDSSDSYQHVNAGYAIDSAGKTRWSLGCFHDLNTYINVLSGGAAPINDSCRL